MAKIEWRDPLRMTIAAVLSLLIAQQLRLPESFWSVLTALVVTRPHLGGTLRAGAGRLAGTLCGAGLAVLVATGRHWHPPELLLLICVLVPLGFLIAFKPEFRTAPVAAIIVLSASPLGNSPLHAAGLRIVEIALGAIVGSLVAWLVLPVQTGRHGKTLAAGVMKRLAAVFEKLQTLPGTDPDIDAEVEECRRNLRGLVAESRVAPWMRREAEKQNAFAKSAIRLGGDAFFAIRMLKSQLPLDATARTTAAELQQMLLRKAQTLEQQQPIAQPAPESEPVAVDSEARLAVHRAAQRYVVGLLRRDLEQLGKGG